MGFRRENFIQIRKAQRWKTSQIAEACGVSRQSMSQWESGKANPSEAHIRKLSQILDVPLSQISTLRDEVPTSDVKIADTIDSVLTFSKTNSDKLHKNYAELIKRAKKQYKNMEQTSIVVKAILSSIPSIFYVKGVDQKYIIVSQAFRDNLKLDPDFKILDKTDYDLFPKDDAKKNDEEDAQVIVSGKPVIDREDFIIGSRKKRWGLISKTPIWEKEKIVGVLGHTVDITEKRRMEAMQKIIAENVAKFNICFTIYDIDKKEVLFTNDATYRTIGVDHNIPAKETLSYWLNNIVHPDDREEQIKYASSKPMSNKRQYRIIHPEKGIRWIEVETSEVIDIYGKKCVTSLSSDITDDKKKKR